MGPFALNINFVPSLISYGICKVINYYIMALNSFIWQISPFDITLFELLNYKVSGSFIKNFYGVVYNIFLNSWKSLYVKVWINILPDFFVDVLLNIFYLKIINVKLLTF